MPIHRILNRFSRVTSSGRFIPEIDGLRFVAIALVVLFHLRSYSLWARPAETYAISPAHDWLARLTSHGFYGVQFFFVISGFILALPFASRYLADGKPVRLGQYYLRRLTRLEPPYIICMVGLFLWLVFFAGSWALNGTDMTAATWQHRGSALLPSLGASLIYQHNLTFGRESFINFVAWSLEIEVQFYLLVPALVAVFRVPNKIVRRTIVCGTAIVFVLLQAWLVPRFPLLHLTILGHLQFFLLGFLLADIFLVDWRRRPPLRLNWDLAALFAWIALLAAWEYDMFVAFVTPAMILLLYIAAFRGQISNQIFRNPAVVTIGGMCYSIYLTHAFLLTRIARLFDRFIVTDYFFIHFLMRGLLVLPFVIAAGAIYFVLIERPCMKRDWPVRLWAWGKHALQPIKEKS